MRFCGLLVLPCLHRYWKWPYGLIKQSRSSTRRHIYLIQTYQIYCIQIYICKRRQPESAKHRRIFMPIWFAYLTILPGSAAGASALNIYSIHGSYGLFSVNFQTFPIVCLYSHKWKLVGNRKAGLGNEERGWRPKGIPKLSAKLLISHAPFMD